MTVMKTTMWVDFVIIGLIVGILVLWALYPVFAAIL
jgi:hypothetical protein